MIPLFYKFNKIALHMCSPQFALKIYLPNTNVLKIYNLKLVVCTKI